MAHSLRPATHMADNPWWVIAMGPHPGVSVVGTGRAEPLARWTAAVALGGQGRYAAAAALLEELVRDPRTPVAIRAHALVTRASHLRQQGGHARAARVDGQALSLAAGCAGVAADLPQPGADLCVDLGSARADALVGLAADALGRGDLGASDRLLTRADNWAVGWRPRVRLRWVRAEVALARGDLDTAARESAAAVAGAAGAGSHRHLVKSRLLAAVTARLRAADPTALAAALAALDGVAAQAADAGLVPLHWAASLAAADAADALEAGTATPPGVRSPSRRSGAKPHPSVIVGPTADGGPPGVPGRPSIRPIGSDESHDRRREEMRESTNGAPGGAPRRRHAASIALSVILDRSEARGRRLMGGGGVGA
ncbi:hypothetical protein [Pseudonocardia sp. WMMC193]|uniref:hypothetical protein n=1 Tax=Pseudonocardia sp. WMMC193 TaxID=2911965 RepID=UPI001F1EF31C|nr:hypothetical protein [Pseudonocardia sp. WMMC193]MCF7553172.1 hypothetical protein [Pseudonocardia sp. WMMC193]